MTYMCQFGLVFYTLANKCSTKEVDLSLGSLC